MTSTARRFLWCSHLAVLGLGVLMGLRGSGAETYGFSTAKCGAHPPPVQSGSRVMVAKSPVDSSQISTGDYAAAWDYLKGRFLPKQERLLVAKALLQEWSVIELEAAVRAVFAETTDEGPGIGGVSVPACWICALPASRPIRSKLGTWSAPEPSDGKPRAFAGRGSTA